MAKPLTTNNRMELLAAIRGLEALKRPCRVQLYTDSVYVRDGITRWIHKWRQNGWRTSDKKPVKNAELWQELVDACAPHRDRMALGEGPQRPRGERPRRRFRLRRGRPAEHIIIGSNELKFTWPAWQRGV